MGELGDEETAVVLGLALNPDTAPALGCGSLGGMVNTNVHLTSLGRDQSELLGIGAVPVVDVAAGRIHIIVVAGVEVALRGIELVGSWGLTTVP